MRRRLYIACALVASACSIVAAPAALSFTLLAASALFAAYKFLRRLCDGADDLHIFRVAALTLTLWLVPLWLVAGLYLPSDFTCMGGEVDADAAPRVDDGVATAEAPPGYEAGAVADEEAFEAVCVPGGPPPVRAETHTHWAGIVDRKALSKPRPSSPPGAPGGRAAGAAAVWVIIDESGRVLAARPIAGHPVLRRAAARAACAARFSPSVTSAGPIRISGVLTYRPDGR